MSAADEGMPSSGQAGIMLMVAAILGIVLFWPSPTATLLGVAVAILGGVLLAVGLTTKSRRQRERHHQEVLDEIRRQGGTPVEDRPLTD